MSPVTGLGPVTKRSVAEQWLLRWNFVSVCWKKQKTELRTGSEISLYRQFKGASQERNEGVAQWP